jgi:hypothetical protein
MVVMNWCLFYEEWCSLSLMAKRSALGCHGIDWLHRVAKGGLLREDQSAKSELGHLMVHNPLTSELLSESAVLDLQQLTNTASDSLLGTA